MLPRPCYPRGSALSTPQELPAPRPNTGAVAEVAYLLIALDRSTPAAVAREVRAVPGVVAAHVTMGEFDVIAVAEQEETRGFPAVAAAVQRIEGVRRVVTCVVVHP